MATLTEKEVRKLEKEFHGPQALGPLTWLVGEWEGNGGVDVSFHNKDNETGETNENGTVASGRIGSRRSRQPPAARSLRSAPSRWPARQAIKPRASAKSPPGSPSPSRDPRAARS